MLRHREINVDGNLWGGVYTFEKTGDVFATHVHTEENNHITIVVYGSVRLTGHPRYEGIVVEAKAGGAIICWTAGDPHGFVAESDGATIINMPKVRP
jgi:hypothetical protein